MALTPKTTEPPKANAKQEGKFVVLGVHRRDLLFIGAFSSTSEANEVAEAGVLQSKFSSTFVFPIDSYFSEGAIRWANPDGVKHEMAEGAPLNPEAQEQELPWAERGESDKDETSKRDQIKAQSDAQEDMVDTGRQPDGTKSPAFNGPKT